MKRQSNSALFAELGLVVDTIMPHSYVLFYSMRRAAGLPRRPHLFLAHMSSVETILLLDIEWKFGYMGAYGALNIKN